MYTETAGVSTEVVGVNTDYLKIIELTKSRGSLIQCRGEIYM